MFDLKKKLKSFLLILKSKKALSLVGFGLLVLGLIAGLILIRYPQILEKKAAFGDPSVRFNPTNTYASVGETYTIKLMLDSGEEYISGVDFTLKYNSEYLEIINIRPDTGLPIAVLPAPEIDAQSGSARFVFVNETENLPKGDFIIANIDFRAKKQSNSDIDLDFQYEVVKTSLTGDYNLIIPNVGEAESEIYIVAPQDGDFVRLELTYSGNREIALDSNLGFYFTVDTLQNQPIIGFDAVIDFDPEFFEAIDMDEEAEGIQVHPVRTFPWTILENRVDNENGVIYFSAGLLSGEFNGRTSPADIFLKPKKIGATTVVINEGRTGIVYGETNIPYSTSNLDINIVPGVIVPPTITPTLSPAPTISPNSAAVEVKVSFQGINSTTENKPHKNLEVKLWRNGYTGAGLNVYVVPQTDGFYVGSINRIMPGDYEVRIKSKGFLQRNFGSVSLSDGLNSFDWTEYPLMVGDFVDEGDDYNVLRLSDITTMINQYTSLEVDATDENRLFDVLVDGKINIFDIGLVLSNWTNLEIRGDE